MNLNVNENIKEVSSMNKFSKSLYSKKTLSLSPKITSNSKLMISNVNENSNEVSSLNKLSINKFDDETFTKKLEIFKIH